MEGRWESSKQGEEARKRGSRSGLEGLSEWRNEAREVAKDLREDDERLGRKQRGTA